MRLIVLILTVVIQLAVAVVGLFILLLGLNGFSEREATPALILYIALSLTSSFTLGASSPFAAKGLAKRTSIGSFGASTIVVVTFCILGVVVLFGVAFASFALAEILRVNR